MGLNISDLESGFTNIKLGELSENVINLLNLNREKCDIIMWEDRFKYIHKHICDFKTPENFINCVANIPEVIANPDYIAKHPTKKSIEYIKRLDELFIVVVRIKSTGNLAFRTAYPLTEKQLQDYIKSGTAIKL
ncbi:MAG: PBECR2 nuclease fold domain-containing protein [Sedimentibacter sp.]